MKRLTLREREDDRLHKLYEAYWRRQNKDRLKRNTYLERSDIWGKGGYAQPITHFDWLAFVAGYRAKRRATK